MGVGAFDGRRISFGFLDTEIVDTALANGKLPLMRVYDKSNGEVYRNKDRRGDYIDELIETARCRGYFGIVLGGGRDGKDYESFLVELRGKMIGKDMMLFSEITPKCPIFISDYSDGAILSTGEGFADEMRQFASSGESTKALVELPVFGFCEDGGFINVADAREMANRNNSSFTDENGNCLSFTDKRHGRICIDSLTGIKNRLDIIADLGYMGISFDIARCPLSYILTYDALFKSVGYASVDKRVRCNSGS